MNHRSKAIGVWIEISIMILFTGKLRVSKVHPVEIIGLREQYTNVWIAPVEITHGATKRLTFSLQ